MTPIDDNHYAAQAGEVITISTHVDKLPFLCGFSDSPAGSAWQNIVPDSQGEQRSFTMPAAGSPAVAVRYVATYSESIAPDDPDPTQTYTIVISGSAGSTRTSFVVIGQSSLPIQISYFFVKAT
jgi:hypothetical protein